MKLLLNLVFVSFMIPGFQANAQVYVMDIDGGRIKEIGNVKDEVGSLDVNRNGDLLLLEIRKNGNPRVFLMKTNGKELKQISEDSTYTAHPIFAPDQQNIIYHNNSQIVQIDRKWSNDSKKVIAYGNSHAISYDGSLMAYNRLTIQPGGPSGVQIFLTKADGSGGEKAITPLENDRYSVDPSFNPQDNTTVVFERWAQGGIVTIKTDGTQERVILDRGSSPRFTPDGRKIVYAMSSNLHIMDANGSNSRPLTNASGKVYTYPVVSSDGKKIFFIGKTARQMEELEEQRQSLLRQP